MLWAITILGAALLAVLCFGLLRLMLFIAGSSIDRRHRQLQHVLETRRPCPAWTVRKRKPRDHCLRQLEQMLRYVRQSPLMADETTRQAVTGELESIRDEWTQPNGRAGD